MTTYIVHVGPPKTGTTYLQSSFHAKRAELLSGGVYYMPEMETNEDEIAHHGLINLLRGENSAPVECMFERLNSRDYRRVLISNEGFPSLSDRELEYFRRLIAPATAEIVFYCRRWSDWLPSSWQQHIKTGGVETFPEFYSKFIEVAPSHYAINYSRILSRYASIFGKENIRLVPYSNILDKKGDIFEVFCTEILQLPMQSPGHQIVNRSGSIFEIELNRIMNVVGTREFRKPSTSVRKALKRVLRKKSNKDQIEMIVDSMRQSVQKRILNDNVPALRPIYDEIMSQFGSSIVATQYGLAIFKKRKKEIEFVKQDYLLNERVTAAINELYLQLRGVELARGHLWSTRPSLVNREPVPKLARMSGQSCRTAPK